MANLNVEITRQMIVDTLIRLESLFGPEMQLNFVAIDPNNLDKTLAIVSSDAADLLSAVRHVTGEQGETLEDGS